MTIIVVVTKSTRNKTLQCACMLWY